MNRQQYTPGIANDILLEHKIETIVVNKKRYLKKGDKIVLRPDRPHQCFQLLIDEFGITDMRLKDFKCPITVSTSCRCVPNLYELLIET